ncbi:MAG: hypothetical protein HY804_09440 [Nitrospinae bacterium]|nr:hypothetical protein [Nitrospinota bacterium]
MIPATARRLNTAPRYAIALAAALAFAACGPTKPYSFNPAAKIAGPASVSVRTQISVNADASGDPEGLPITYTWALTQRPQGSAAALSGDAGKTTTFYADKGGVYTVELVVTNEDTKSSSTASHQIDAVGTNGNHPPVANFTATTGTRFALLDARESYDMDGDPTYFYWAALNAPAGSYITVNPQDTRLAYLYLSSGAKVAVELTVADHADRDVAVKQIDLTN